MINKINEYFRKRNKLDEFKLPFIYLIYETRLLFGGGIFEIGKNGEILGWKQTFNLSDPVEKQLSRINGFYEVLMGVYTDRLQMLYDSVYYDKEERVKEAKRIWEESKGKIDKILLEWYGDGMEQSAYGIIYDYEKDKIYYGYDDMDIKEEEKIDGELTREEFNLLMQIYFGVYDDEKIKKELEEKEKRGEYEKCIKLWSILNKKINQCELDMKDKFKKIRSKLEKEVEKIDELEEKRKIWDKFYEERYKELEKCKPENLLTKEEFKEYKNYVDYLKLQLLRKPTDGSFKIKLEEYKKSIEKLEKQIRNKEEEYKKSKIEKEIEYKKVKKLEEKIRKIEKGETKKEKALILYLLLEIRKEYKIKTEDDTRKVFRNIIDWLIGKKEELEIELKEEYLNTKIEETKEILKEVKKQLEEKDKRIKKELEDLKILLEKNKKVLLEGKPEKLIFRKIYDKNWNEEEQKKVVEKINKELGKEVVVLEE